VRRTIETSFADGPAVQVVSGLRPGEKVVVLGQYEIEDGAAVTPAKESP
jgi:multidrug efflux pump subunit AcrA (membrane-fusion protein)